VESKWRMNLVNLGLINYWFNPPVFPTFCRMIAHMVAFPTLYLLDVGTLPIGNPLLVLTVVGGQPTSYVPASFGILARRHHFPYGWDVESDRP